MAEHRAILVAIQHQRDVMLKLVGKGDSGTVDNTGGPNPGPGKRGHVGQKITPRVAVSVAEYRIGAGIQRAGNGLILEHQAGLQHQRYHTGRIAQRPAIKPLELRFLLNHRQTTTGQLELLLDALQERLKPLVVVDTSIQAGHQPIEQIGIGAGRLKVFGSRLRIERAARVLRKVR